MRYLGSQPVPCIPQTPSALFQVLSITLIHLNLCLLFCPYFFCLTQTLLGRGSNFEFCLFYTRYFLSLFCSCQGNARSGYINISTQICVGSKTVKSSLMELFRQITFASNKVTINLQTFSKYPPAFHCRYFLVKLLNIFSGLRVHNPPYLKYSYRNPYALGFSQWLLYNTRISPHFLLNCW